ncbi:MAG: sigma-70 family RNA polymerase sigma factor [Candidatus Baltobacteraceae bacterium]
MDRNAEELVARVRARDADAFETLYDAYHRLVYGVAMRMLGDVAASEDLTQAVFLKVWSTPELFRGGNFAAWIVRVTRNRALDTLRSRSARPESELPESLPESDSIEDVAFAHLNAASLRTALEQLPREQREPIELGFFSGVTHEEIARQSGIPLGTIKTRIRAGLRRLRAMLDGVVTA